MIESLTIWTSQTKLYSRCVYTAKIVRHQGLVTSLCFQHPLGFLECAAKVEALCFKPLSSELVCSRNNNG